jgi:Zn-dependent protease with chaperone function
MRRRNFLAVGGACLLCGCAGALHRLPSLSSDEIRLASEEIGRTGGAPQRRLIADEEAYTLIARAIQRVRPYALAVCQEVRAGVCVWDIRISPDRSPNAAAGPGGRVIINRGIADFAENEEQIALVVAHELAHQAANHVATSQQNQVVGAILGALILGVAAAYAGRGSYYGADIARTSMDAGASIGGAIGRISFSKEQEREADYLAAVILYRAGVDLDRARGLLVTMARASARRETGLLDTHPAGPERLAAWDRAVADIRHRNGRLPERALAPAVPAA